jgi:hypothetical protein
LLGAVNTLVNQRSVLASCVFPVLLFALTVGCDDKRPARPSSPPRHPPITFSQSWEAALGFPDSALAVATRIDRRLVASATTNNGVLHSTSLDDGVSWSAPVHVNLCDRPLFPFRSFGNSLWYLSQRTAPDGGQSYIHTPAASAWNPAIPLRDSEWGHAGGFRFAFDSLGGAYVVFNDARDGNLDIYFSYSSDRGKTWSPNVRINDDHTGQEQHEPFIACSPEGKVVLVWSDNRDAHSLFDIYSATSSDRGKTWSRNIKVNDDSAHVWQVAPVVVYHRRQFSAAWMDYRRGAEGGSVRSAIYFSSSHDGGTTWSRNVLLSENRPGNCGYPTFQSDGDSLLECMWMDASENILNDVFYVHSTDAGASWSLPAKVNDDSTRTQHYHRGIGVLGDIVGWLDSRSGSPRVRFARKLLSQTTLMKRIVTQEPRAQTLPVRMSYRVVRDLLRDSFATNPSSRWRVLAGTWVWKDGSYIGYGTRANSSVLGDEGWRDYRFTGKFKLDGIDHREAHLFIRLTERGGLRYYRIANLFRSGIRLDYFDGNNMSSLAEVSFSVERDRWYAFDAVVKGNVLNYSLNDTLRFSFGGLVQLQRGKIGVGSQTTPTYFRDIRVHAVE